MSFIRVQLHSRSGSTGQPSDWTAVTVALHCFTSILFAPTQHFLPFRCSSFPDVQPSSQATCPLISCFPLRWFATAHDRDEVEDCVRRRGLTFFFASDSSRTREHSGEVGFLGTFLRVCLTSSEVGPPGFRVATWLQSSGCKTESCGQSRLSPSWTRRFAKRPKRTELKNSFPR